MSKRTLLVPLCLLFFIPVPAAAWNNAGHKTVGLLAYRNDGLPDKTKKQLLDILMQHPHFDCYLDAQRPEGIKRDEWIIARAATWPDFVRSLSTGPCKDVPVPDSVLNEAKALKIGSKNNPFHRADWHFQDNPVVPSGQKGIDPNMLQPEAPNAVSKLEELTGELRKGSLPAAERAIALCWVLHLVGDIHQPMHAAKLYSDQFPPKDGDRGGNFFFVPNRRHAPNLHHYWDSLLGEDDHFESVDLVVERIRHTPRFSRQTLKESLKNAAVSDWSKESFRMAVELVYRRGTLKGLDTRDHHAGGHVPALSQTYEDTALEAAFVRGALAGHRLADTLSSLFSGASPTTGTGSASK
jgi:S1/P1 Nuclease